MQYIYICLPCLYDEDVLRPSKDVVGLLSSFVPVYQNGISDT